LDQSDRQEHSKFWFVPQLDNLELLRATYVTYAFAPHFHETYAIGVTEAGAQVYTCQGARQLLMPAGSVAVVHPGEVHTSRAANRSGWSYRMLYPGADLLERAASEAGGRPCAAPSFASPVIADPVLACLVRNLHVALEDPATTLLERESRLLWMLTQLILRHADGCSALRLAGPETVVVNRIRSYLNDRFAEPIRLEQLASLANLSAFHLLRVFRNAVGLPPHAYLIQVRLARAKRLLQAGQPIAEVAAQTGFVDQSHFSRHFKRVVGVPPGSYRPDSKNVQDTHT
jgi:AraC-like DNA-binding protein